MKRILILGSILLALGMWNDSHAGGFNIYEMGSRATSLGGAFTATADDPTALFYNPAGIGWLNRGIAVSANVSPIAPISKFTRASGATVGLYPGDVESQTADRIYMPTGLYMSYRHNERWSGGVGFFTPFGLGVDWDDPETFPGRTLSTNSQIRSYYISPVITFRPHSSIAFSAGVHFVVSTLKLEKILTQSFGTDGTAYNVIKVDLEGTSGLSVAPAAALMIRPSERFSFGVNFKGGVTNTFEDQDGDLKHLPTGIEPLDLSVAAQLNQLGRKQKVGGDLKYPAILSIGMRYMPADRLALMADFVWFGWHTFDKVELEFSNPALNTILREDYQDGQEWRFGAEYIISESFRFMGGLAYDNNPQPIGSVSPLLADANRWDYSLGLTYTMHKMEITAGYMLVTFEERSTVVNGEGFNYDGFDGVYKNIAHIPTLGLTYHF
ncbi:MAG: outer membrane protein transport protein [Candidatus Eisenbacteria bacterium]|uniref:Outer membrane protein transport protein n=1 Tax=Eiseniibacteriota bacterium TaxID=2212470 RepID=A0A948W8C4_UNCEI|nr:outer membrane protein transport protein [Candidatus Eisenbacteria bacterium]MBU1949515.1 outer membrane protein transport protein [Candidatus Eisenbacteria bacterium]MBU2692546.1 outer membrane protein transport protein [Candidatus Eisenbacteria bacterium]